MNMLGLAKRCRARFLISSTSEVYGDPLQHPQVGLVGDGQVAGVGVWRVVRGLAHGYGLWAGKGLDGDGRVASTLES
jgi:hypothetical protein